MRWQVRAAPAFAGTERAHPKEALAAFWNSHAAKLEDGMKEVIDERIATLAPFSLDAFVPKARKRMCRDSERHDLPSLPPAEIADAVAAESQNWQKLTWPQLEQLLTCPLLCYSAGVAQVAVAHACPWTKRHEGQREAASAHLWGEAS